MSCFLSKFCSIRTSSVQLRKLYVPANNLLGRRTFNQPFRHQKRFQSHTSSLLGPILFCISVSSSATVIAAILQYERLNNSASITSLHDLYGNFKHHSKNKGSFSLVVNTWDNLSTSEKVFSAILVLNTLVFLAWQVPRWQPLMVKYFTTDAMAKNLPVSSLLLSAFSHSSPVHLGFNMYALYTFCRGVIQPWGEMSPEEFSAMYLSSCVMSSLASIVFRRNVGRHGASLGASGAILSVVGYFALSHPNEKLSVIFVPAFQFDAINGLYGLISLDLMGLALGWQTFDHAAHLGGSFFGMFWYKYVSKHIWSNRRFIVKNWITLKKTVQEQRRKW